jgi:hypothetical protein
MRNVKNVKKAEKMFGKNRVVLKLMTITLLLLPALVGCAKPHMLAGSGYEFKQIQRGTLETTYVLCKGCIEYTKIQNR